MIPQGLKPGSFMNFSGTAEAVPFPRPAYETASYYWPSVMLA